MSSTVDPPTQTASPTLEGLTRRDNVAIAVFGTWAIIGLFVDGWAHNVNKPESFFTPWHGILYSGVGAAIAWFAVDAIRRPESARLRPDDRLLTAGLLLFLAAAVGDGLWHEIFGIEEDLEALLSPTHLGLMIGGLLMLSAPTRAVWHRDDVAGSTSGFAPVGLSIGLCVALISFFFMYVSAFRIHRLYSADPSISFDLDEAWQVHGVLSVLFTTTMLVAPVLLALRRWPSLPRGGVAAIAVPATLLMTILDGFDLLATALVVVGGAVALEVLLAGAAPSMRRIRLVAMGVPAVTWPVWFGVLQLQGDMGWTADLWTGTVVLSAMTGLGLSLLTHPPERIPAS